MALISFAVYLTAKTFYAGADTTAQLKFVENSSEQPNYSETAAAEPLKQVLSGEAYDTALRLRESGALLMAVSLSSFETFRTNGRFPATANEILSDLQRRTLLPPGIDIEDGVLHSSLSELKLNYRTDPFSFEILSLPISKPEGPAILFRSPLPPTQANSIAYFQSSSSEKTPFIPSQFSTPEQLVAAGWNIRNWRGETMLLDDSTLRDLQEQNAWLKTLNQGSK